MNILAIETSCDDTSASVMVENIVRSNVVASQGVHTLWGGIVPELASREHVGTISRVVDAALAEAHVSVDSLDAIAVTNGPGLAGSLLVGAHFAKGMGLRLNLPVYPINHIEAHIYSAHIEHSTIPYPALGLVVSGGHTSLVLLHSIAEYEFIAHTSDDAAGEAFDKVSKMLGLGYPGGPIIDKYAKNHTMAGNQPTPIFPRSWHHAPQPRYSFSGIKTAVRQYITQQPKPLSQSTIEAIACAAQSTIVDTLLAGVQWAIRTYSPQCIVVSGGVSANSWLRVNIHQTALQANLPWFIPQQQYCVDNAGMIANRANQLLTHGIAPSQDFIVQPKPIRNR
jgi:N6-L-threonylcarbamoyladenine synthase